MVLISAAHVLVLAYVDSRDIMVAEMFGKIQILMNDDCIFWFLSIPDSSVEP